MGYDKDDMEDWYNLRQHNAEGERQDRRDRINDITCLEGGVDTDRPRKKKIPPLVEESGKSGFKCAGCGQLFNKMDGDLCPACWIEWNKGE